MSTNFQPSIILDSYVPFAWIEDTTVTATATVSLDPLKTNNILAKTVTQSVNLFNNLTTGGLSINTDGVVASITQYYQNRKQ
jgi:hypothetical protein